MKSVADLKANPKNPRVITDAKLSQLAKSMQKFGDLSGIVFNSQTGQVVGGTQRSKNLDPESKVVITKSFETPTRTGTIALGYVDSDGERFSYREVDWDVHTEMAANIAANKGAGEWDREQLGLWMKELSSFDVSFDLELTMFDEEELEEWGFKAITVSEHERINAKTGVDEDDVPEKAPARTKKGDLYVLGAHRLLCGDSTCSASVDRLMKGQKANLVFTDPPYGVSYVGKTKEKLTIKNDSLDDEKLEEFLRAAIAELPVHAGSAIYMCAPPGRTEGVFRTAWKAAELELRQCLVWVKQQFVMGRQDYHWRHESILYGWKDGASHYFIDDRTQDTVWNFDRPFRNEFHPTMKPVELIEKAVTNSSKDGENVFDGFSGSGSTLIACEKTGRKCFAMEIDPTYCDVIVDRWEKYTGEKAKLVSKSVKIKKNKKPAQTG